MRLSINAKLLASGVILASVATGFAFELSRNTDVLSRAVGSVFSDAVEPRLDIDGAAGRIKRLQDRILADTSNPGAPLSLSADAEARVLDDLSSALGALRAASGRISDPTLTDQLRRLDFAISRLRATEGDVTRRLLRRELASVLGSLEQVTQALDADIRRLRAGTETQGRYLSDLNWLSLAVLLGVGLLLSIYLARGISAPIRHAATTLREVANAEDGIPPPKRHRDALRDLTNAVAFVEALVMQRAELADRRDRTRQDRTRNELAEQTKRFDAALDRMTQAYCVLDAAGHLQSANEAFRQLFPALPRRADADQLAADADFSALLAQEGTEDAPVRLRSGRSLYVLRHRAARDGEEILVFGDVTDRETARAAMEKLDGEDRLTGLPNRASFLSRIGRMLEDGRRLSVVILDIDGFRNTNTTLGHMAGDDLLRQVGLRIVAAAGPQAYVARLGADEFGIAVASAAVDGDPRDGERLCRVIVQDLQERPVTVAGRPLLARAAAGVVTVPPATERGEAADPYAIMQDCELALQRARADGPAKLQVFAPELRTEVEARRRLVADLHDALERREFELHFQPIVDCRRQAVSGFEALARWTHPQRGPVSPGEFIPAMEEAGLIGALGRYVLREGCRQAARWPADLSISINLSPLQVKSPNIVADVRAALSASGLAPARLHLEVTESLFLDDAESVLDTLQSLRRMGLVVSMDDFGTGYSSLGYLSRFPFDKIKIDQSFVRDMSRSENIAIVRAVMGLSNAMQMSVVAEGVETAEQMEVLRAEGCREMQGYLFSRPRPAGDLPKMLMEIRSRFRAGGFGPLQADNDPVRVKA